MSRDKLLAYLWPESDAEHARNSLKQAVFALRRDLRSDALVLGGSELKLNSDVIRTDVGEFETALATGELERGVAVYRGPFLEGFHARGLRDFDQWVEAQRDRLSREYAGALESLARGAASREDYATAAAWWRRRAAADPLDSRIALELMCALVAAGDRVGAVRHAHVHERLLRDELDIAPEAAITTLVERLRMAPSATPTSLEGMAGLAGATAAEAPPCIRERPLGQDQGRGPASPLPVRSGALLERATDGRLLSRQSRATMPLALSILAVAMAVGGTWIAQRHSPASGGAASAVRVAVLPFAYHGRDELAYLGGGVADLLSTALDGAGELRTVDPRSVASLADHEERSSLDPRHAHGFAARLGARLFAIGSVLEAEGQLRVSVSLYDAQRGTDPIATAAAAGEAARVFQLVDRLAADLLAGRKVGDRDRLRRIAAVTTGSLAAYKAYLRGEREFRLSNYGAARDAFGEAVELDTAFALAYYRLSVAADWSGTPDLPGAAAERATRYAHRLPRRERMLLEALVAWRRDDADQAERLYREVLALYGEDFEARYQLAEVLFHGNPLRGRSVVEARHSFERVLALRPNDREALIHLARIAAVEHKSVEVDTLVRRALALRPDSQDLALRAFRAFAIGDDAEQRRVLSALHGADHRDIYNIAWRIAIYADNLHGAARVAAVLTTGSRTTFERAFGHVLLAHLKLTEGRWHAAHTELRRVGLLMPAWKIQLEGGFSFVPYMPHAEDYLVALRDSLTRWDPARLPDVPPTAAVSWPEMTAVRMRRYLLGMLAVRLGDYPDALRYAAELAHTGRGSEPILPAARQLSRNIRAAVALARERPEEALTAIGALELRHAHPLLAGEAERYLRGEASKALGRNVDALRWYGSFEQLALEAMVFAAPGHLNRGEIYERLGEWPKATREYTRFTELWRNSDPELQPLVMAVKARVARLRTRGASR